ncbi:MAG: gliding motility-associated C-terminal domain-containing protein [Saprospiraceae bacterium]|jgi:gliding motility-associated-like protein|nr:gliding motility-associated C-terminal domain-containing protein [Saprospiraceae bacterium]
MKKFFILLLFLGAWQMQAQTPDVIIYNGRAARDAAKARMMCNSAGTFEFGQHFGQSNDVTPDTLYLCFGDSIRLEHNGDMDLSGDPVPATPAGVGYAFYECPPTVTGPSLGDIVADPCIANNPPPAGGLYVFTRNGTNGDATFFNGGVLQNFFNAGAPILLWFAPITYDRLNFPNAEFEGNPAGPCVNVNTAEQFAVVYLNAITATNINPNTGATGCLGSFTVQGGLPEFNANSFYSVDISFASDPTIKGTLMTGSPSHGETLEFYVPRPGNYIITIEDGKSCGASFNVNMSACQAVSFQLPLENALPGDNVCIDVLVEDFVNVGSIQWSISWDSTVLQYTGVQAFNPNMPDLSAGIFALPYGPGSGTLTMSWIDASFGGVTLLDGSSLFQICFNVIGVLGESSDITITNSPTPIEVGDPSTPEPVPFGVIIRNGVINISDLPLFLLIEQDSVTCAGDSNGGFTLTVASGMAPYQYSWNTVPPAGPNNGPVVIATEGGMSTVNNLPAGVYQVTVTDSSIPPIVVMDTVQVLAAPQLGVEPLFQRPSCFGESDGSVQAQIVLDGVVQSGPSTGYSFTWNTTTEDTSTLSNIPSGFYAVTVTDPLGCEATASVTLSQPAALTILPNNTFITNASCTGAEDGSITVTASGGTAAGGVYTFQWDNGLGTLNATTATVTDLLPGSYCVTVTDDNNCTFNTCFTVGAVKTLTVTPVIDNVNCNAACDGQIFVTGSTSGAPADLPYTFTWNSTGNPPVNSNTTSLLTGLCAGTYFLTMTDASAAACQLLDTFVVSEPQPLDATILELVNESCVVGNDGLIVTGVTGGTFPYDYNWAHDGALQDSIAANLTQGSYSLTVTDANGCTDTLSATVLAPTPPSITQLNDDAVSCASNCDGMLSVTAVAGGAPIAGYAWSNMAVGANIVSLCPGTYVVTVTAEDGCQAIDTAMVTSPAPLSLDSFSLQLPTCPGDANGQITVFVSGGTGPYNYIWSTNPGQVTTINPIAGLAAGNYGVTVIDANNCTPLPLQVTLPDPPSINVSFTALTPVSCPDDITCDGQATATAVYSDGSAGLFNFIWSSGEASVNVPSASAIQLCRGPQQLTVNDGVCGIDTVFIVPTPPNINIAVDQEPVSCNGLSDGSISLAPSGGTGPYSYLWTPGGQVTQIINNLNAGVYTAVITDANGCSKEQIVQLSEPDALMLSLDPNISTPTVSCNGGADGIMAVVYNVNDNINPVGPAPYTWSGSVAPATANIANNLNAGVYSVTITDIKGCQDSLSFTIGEPTPITVVLEPTLPPLCFGDPTLLVIDTVYGGGGQTLDDYTYELDFNGLNFPANQPATIFAGNHVVIVQDSLGCTVETELFIDQPAEIQVSLPTEIVVELGDTSVQIVPTIFSSLPIDSYLWTPADYLSSDTVQSPFVRPLESLDYNLLVTDVNGCTGTADVFVELDANRNVYIPNVFSPNGDGPNDEFRIFACRGVEVINFVRIFDRWGDQVYQSDNVPIICEGGSPLWDGKFRGKPVQQGVYVYLIEVKFLDNVTLLYRGDVTVIR